MPRARPTSSPRATFSLRFGDAGFSGATASRPIETLTVEGPPLAGVSRAAMTWVNFDEIAWARAAAIAGLVSLTEMSMSEVLSGELAVTWVASVSARMSSPVVAITGLRTSGLVTSWA